jgi:hypothetical protein
MVCFWMKHIQGTSRSQTLLLPACVDDYVGPDNVVRFIEAFVDSLDLAVAGFDRAVPKTTGRPGYDPSDLLKLYIYGYLYRVRSSRRLESETHRNLEVIRPPRQKMCWRLSRPRPMLTAQCAVSPAASPSPTICRANGLWSRPRANAIAAGQIAP